MKSISELVNLVESKEMTKSECIRILNKEYSLSNSEISKLLNIRFQFVYNVLHTNYVMNESEKLQKIQNRIDKKEEELRILKLKLK
jgi:predicted transcriptional regulator